MAPALIALAACSGGGDDAAKGKGKGGQPGQGTPTVGYVVIQPSSVAMTTELSARTTAFESSDVRPQVTGIIRRRFFTEGTLVQKGQPLYEIDPRLYRAAANEAQANLQSARANEQAQRVLANRYKPLAEMEAISQQDYTNAIATSRQATASVAQTRAALETAQINLKFTTVPAPITGRIGRSLFTVGALVSATQTDPLAQIQRLDPMFVDIQQSSGDLLALRRSLGQNGIVPTRAEVRLKLEDGSDYGATGTVEFAEALVNTETGTVTLRARFPNPQGLLLPGMFVQARFAQAINQRAFLVPQAGLSRDAKGNATVYVVDANNKAVQKKVKADRTQGAFWVVTSGLNPGDRIITQGLSKIAPNQGVKPVPENTAQRIEAPKQDSSGGDASQKKAG
ncbi:MULTISPECIES: efflux RND transporter periplasmic adaptor subunit [unclassified Sphingomonas]|jgi:membrane fusion protein (multidrug efflux system)|uniref:efflux RND transporter periplasmic adaptor subunit n=1 Tax=unclassified Sphingomonas TaxID=196159 RepID=UPI0006FB2E98|nr:efflux RND transporter periplasmic adaptor subunit [Sphingomonas sp. Leaf20]KQM71817.1 hemolysin D [Sphingomonas sp. Leaf20]